MLDIGSKIIQLRKKKNWSQTDLSKEIKVSRTIIGNYERNENMPSVEILLKMAKAFDVSVDFLIGEAEVSNLDKAVLQRIYDIEKLDEDTKSKLFFLIDNVVQNFKTKQAFSA
ncbi:helix-turn-helix domain-containing protein [Aquimarina agarivorans]|uniref:helix-turn-helix domain-containing protein n=1 Tax=Aquimarina agarivorans TaxID=980584 RepID=UPI000248EAAB|nr:helix-turn-helix transcriptional regulator [Aquimarina agarivorans]